MLKREKVNILLSLIAAVIVLAVFSASPALAKEKESDLTPIEKAKIEKRLGADDSEDDSTEGDPYETGEGVHAEPATFQKDFSLTPEQKTYTITEMQKIVSEIIDPQMSDLEKYYVLALWVNKHVEYDWQFWNGRYFMELYSHQWDSYGGMKEDERSVCVGISIFYANMCHAAGLPCKFVRTNPKFLDHTLNYIPDINGHAYFVDVTENIFLMSEHSKSLFSHIDKEFSNITQDADDETFDYYEFEGGDLVSSTIKDYYDTPFKTWFNEYAHHENTNKIFKTPYEEKGSGRDGENHAAYSKYDSNRTANPGIWFLDDFYEDPAAIERKMRNKEFDSQLIDVSGVKKNYDCSNSAELLSAVKQKISVNYFPSLNEDGEIVAKAAELDKDTEYEVTCPEFDTEAKTAVLKIEGKDAYKGTYEISVKLNSAVVSKDPVPKRGLIYNGTQQALIEPGEAECGEIRYALGTKEEEPKEEDFTTTIPTATESGSYYVWYMAVGDGVHGSSKPKCMEGVATIGKIPVKILVPDRITIKMGENATISPALSAKIPAKYTFESMDEDVVTVDDKGVVTGVQGGLAAILVNAVLREPNSNYDVARDVLVMVRVQSEGIDISETKVGFDKSSFTYNGMVQKPVIKTIKGWELKEGTDYTVKWSDGSSKNAGTYKVTITGTGKYTGSTDATYTIKKAANPMRLKAKTVTVKGKSLKKKSKSVAGTKALTVSRAEGKLSYKLASAKKGKKNFGKMFKVDAKTGKVTMKKGLKTGTYMVTVKVRAKGNANYTASAWKAVKIKVKVN